MIFRNLLFYLFLIPVTASIAALGLTLFFLPYGIRYWLITRWSHFFIFWAKVTCGLHYNIIGLENLPKEAAIVLSNHQSAWETIFFQVLLPKQTWVLKKELLYIPLFGWGLALISPIAIDRKQFNSIKEIIQQGKEKLQLGRWVIIFPEGTRVKPGEHKRFSRTGAALAADTGYPVVPIAHNAGKFWPKGLMIRNSGTITVAIGPTIETKGKTATEINALAENWIKMRLEKITGICQQ